MFLLILCFIVIVLSGILSFFNIQATYNKVASLLGVKADVKPEKLSEAEIKEMFDFLKY